MTKTKIHAGHTDEHVIYGPFRCILILGYKPLVPTKPQGPTDRQKLYSEACLIQHRCKPFNVLSGVFFSLCLLFGSM